MRTTHVHKWEEQLLLLLLTLLTCLAVGMVQGYVLGNHIVVQEEEEGECWQGD